MDHAVLSTTHYIPLVYSFLWHMALLFSMQYNFNMHDINGDFCARCVVNTFYNSRIEERQVLSTRVNFALVLS